jgi:hypothetical protein
MLPLIDLEEHVAARNPYDKVDPAKSVGALRVDARVFHPHLPREGSNGGGTVSTFELLKGGKQELVDLLFCFVCVWFGCGVHGMIVCIPLTRTNESLVTARGKAGVRPFSRVSSLVHLEITLRLEGRWTLGTLEWFVSTVCHLVKFHRGFGYTRIRTSGTEPFVFFHLVYGQHVVAKRGGTVEREPAAFDRAYVLRLTPVFGPQMTFKVNLLRRCIATALMGTGEWLLLQVYELVGLQILFAFEGLLACCTSKRAKIQMDSVVMAVSIVLCGELLVTTRTGKRAKFQVNAVDVSLEVLLRLERLGAIRALVFLSRVLCHLLGQRRSLGRLRRI